MNKAHLAALLAVSLTLGGCAATAPNDNSTTDSRQTSKTAKGAGLGALAGAAIGAMTSNKSGRAKGVLTGAAIGAAAGGGIGYAMDRQEEKLRAQTKNTGVELQRSGDTLNVVLPGDISFDTGSSIVKASFRPPLDSVAQSLVEYPDSQIQVYGHTDSVGTHALNMRLAQDRAQAVANYLQSRGVNANRINVIAIGPDNPVADNATAEGRAKNRRVEIKIVPNQQ